MPLLDFIPLYCEATSPNIKIYIFLRVQKYAYIKGRIKWYKWYTFLGCLLRPLQSRFRRLHLPSYTEEQFLEVSVKVLPKLKIAHIIGKAVWDQRGDIRDVISIGKLVRKNDGPEEVEQILITMIKYGEMKEY